MCSRLVERVSLAALVLLVPVSTFASGRPVSVSAADGTMLSGLYFESSSRPSPGVVLVHMLGRSKEEWTSFAERLQASGLSVLTFDLRGHGRSTGNGTELAAMADDVEAALGWMAAQPAVRGAPIGLVGASLGANLAGVVGADSGLVRAVALISPSLEYRGVRLDAAVMKKLGGRAVFLAASTDDPYATRTVKELAGTEPTRETRFSALRGHGTTLLNADQELTLALVDWLRQRLIF